LSPHAPPRLHLRDETPSACPPDRRKWASPTWCPATAPSYRSSKNPPAAADAVEYGDTPPDWRVEWRHRPLQWLGSPSAPAAKLCEPCPRSPGRSAHPSRKTS